jgi:uncharacterized protein (TIGR03000 family)
MSLLRMQRNLFAKNFVWIATVAASLALAFSLDAKADSWGSWGGSHGSTGYGGSSGGFGSSGGWVASGSSGGSHGGGLFGGHRPVRNLLGRISDHFHAKHSRGSNGSTGYVGGGSSGFSYASNGSHGSHGGMGSVGSSLGSTGVAYGSMGTGYGSSGGSTGHVVGYPQMGWSNGIQSPVIYDSGFNHQGTVIPNGSPAVKSEGTDFRPVDGINFEGTGQYYNSPVPPASRPDADNSTGLTSPSATVLNLKLPADAQVFINDKLTKTPGESRRYIARNLQPNNEYYYNVKAVVVRDGVEKVRSQMVSIAAGSSKTVEIDFDQTFTAVAVNVPADAKITLCGKATSASGASRIFSTDKLEEGQEWSDYTIEVELERNGRTIRQEKKLDIVGGQTYQVDFEFDSVNQLLAVK